MFKSLIAVLMSALLVSTHVAVATQKSTDELRARLSALIPDLEPSSIKPTPVEGIYEVTYGAQVLYLSKDGRYYFRGDLVDLKTRTDLTEATRAQARKKLLSRLDEEQMIVFSPEDPKHTITVFTDIDCGYCRKLHAEIDQYLSRGIKVRYMAFPRSGLDSPSFDKAVNVWCAENRNAAITKAKQDQPVQEASCENPVQEQMELGQLLGVSGTPAIVLENGEMIPGYQPAKPLAAMLNELASAGAPQVEAE
jgi:thiol:disulfide interchange protein DsbC